jgi:hypothetical protein
VAGTLLAGGYLVHAVTQSDRAKATTTNVGTNTTTNTPPAFDNGRPNPPIRGDRRPGGQNFGPPGAVRPGGDATPATGRA